MAQSEPARTDESAPPPLLRVERVTKSFPGVLALQDVIGRADADPYRRQIGLGAVCLYVALVAATFVFFHPVLTGDPLTHAEWLQRMWFPSWF